MWGLDAHLADDAVVDAAGGVAAFQLGEEVNVGPGAEVPQFDEGRIADGVKDIGVVHVASMTVVSGQWLVGSG